MRKKKYSNKSVSDNPTLAKVEQTNSKEKRWLIGGSALFLTLIMLHFLGELFPYTGLQAIIMYPFIVIVNSLIILGAIFLTRKLNTLVYISTWIATFMLTIYIAMKSFPQDGGPGVFEQISYGISAIENFDRSPKTDLDLPKTTVDFGRFGAEERYIVALYKYRNTIPLDGSFSLCQHVVSYNTNTTIKSISEIPKKFATGHNKLIWWRLEHLEK